MFFLYIYFDKLMNSCRELTYEEKHVKENESMEVIKPEVQALHRHKKSRL